MRKEYKKEYKKEYLVGINYFSGWWRQYPNKYQTDGNRDWRRDYPDRTALLGCYNDQETMDAEIEAASSHGVDFFLMLWYVEKPERHPHGTRLNNGLRQFIASKESYKMKFAIEYCNHKPFLIEEEEMWRECCIEWVEMMKHPSYLRIGNKALFKVHSLYQFTEECKGDPVKAKNRLDYLRNMAMSEGVGELLIGIGIIALHVSAEKEIPFIKLFDYCAIYMDVPELIKSDHAYQYEKLLELAEKSWEVQGEKSLIPHMPYLPSGWMPDPWGDKRPSFEFPDKSKWLTALNKIKEALDKERRLRLPNDTFEGQKIFNIYAWNEFGEGGITAPTFGDGWMKLEGIHEVYGL